MFSSFEAIVLSEGRAQVVSFNVQKTMDAAEFIKNVDIKKDSYETPLLPPGTIFYRCAKEYAGYVIEGAPRICSFSSQTHKDMTFQVPIPWHVFIAKVDLRTGVIRPTYMFFTKGPIKGLDDMLYHTWLPNQYHDRDGSLCLGHDDDTHRIEIGSADVSIRRRLQMLVSHVYNSSFNDSLTVPKKFVPLELRTTADHKLGGEQMHTNYYRLANGSEVSHKWLALSHLYFMRNVQSKTEAQLCNEVNDWDMAQHMPLNQFLTRKVG
jgi:hypothetical protein